MEDNYQFDGKGIYIGWGELADKSIRLVAVHVEGGIFCLGNWQAI